MSPWITAAIAVFALACLGGLVCLVRYRTPDSLPRPGSDTQFAAWINDQEQSDRAEGEGQQ